MLARGSDLKSEGFGSELQNEIQGRAATGMLCFYMLFLIHGKQCPQNVCILTRFWDVRGLTQNYFSKIDAKTSNPKRLFSVQIFLATLKGKKKTYSAPTWRGRKDLVQK